MITHRLSCNSALAVVGASLLGCVAPSMPPHMSFSRHLGPTAEGGETKNARIGMSTGAVIMTQPDEGSMLALFPTEGFLTYSGKHYSGSFAAGHFLGSYEGSLLFVNNEDARIGLLHGLGIGYIRETSEEDDAASALFYDVSAGTMLEVHSGENGSGFLAFRYTYANALRWPAADVYRQTDYLTFGIGAHLRLGRLEVVPELVYSRGSWQAQTYGWQPGAPLPEKVHVNYIIPMITFSTSF